MAPSFPYRPCRGPSVSSLHARRLAAWAAALACAGPASGQPASGQPASAAAGALPAQQVEITGRAASATDLTGFAEPLARTPIDATVIGSQTLADLGALTLSDLPRIDASVSDSYDAVGYWSTFTIRGFPIDNRYNFRRDGLPINGETMLPLENKSAVEVLKGLSGMQAGTSAPGGLVNLVVKRPDADLRSATLLWSQPGTVGAQLDLSQRFGADRQFGTRLNVSVEHLDPDVRDARGHHDVLALATDWRIDGDHVLEFEVEHSLQSQPSVPGFSMLGPVVPDPHAIDPRINLNDQPWSLPVVMQGNTMSLRYTQAVAEGWQLRLQAMQQRLVSNDHIAFPFGVFTDPNTCNPCDRFSSDGHFSLWDYRSDDERRQTRVADAALTGTVATGMARHTLTLEALVSRLVARFDDLAYNLAGTGTIDGLTIVPAAPTPSSPNTNRDERNTELSLRDEVKFDPAWSAWGGVRRTALHRASWQTATGDPSQSTDYRQAFNTPWLAVSRALGPADMAYLSWGEGVESNVTPNLPIYADPGRAQPATISRQWEAGWKHAEVGLSWSIVAYDVQQPQYSDITDPLTSLLDHVRDGVVRALGLELESRWHGGPWTLQASAMGQRVRHLQATVADGTGPLPPNVPERALKLLAAYSVGAVPGLAVLANMAYEGPRAVLPDDSVFIPAWTRFDLGARLVQPVGATTLTWRLGVDNVFDRRAWRESPYQYAHVYLFPLAPRTWHASVEASF